MKFKKLVAAIGCVCLISGTSFSVYTYAGNEGADIKIEDKINNPDDLAGLDAYLQQMLGKKIKLTPHKMAVTQKASETPETSNYVIMSKEEYIRDQRGEYVEGTLPAKRKPKKAAVSDKRANASKTLSAYDLGNAKKVYVYSDRLIGKIQNGLPLEEEAFSWQVPMVNALGENGVIYIEKFAETGEFITTSIESPADDRELFLGNQEITDFVSGAIGDAAGIKAIYFVDMPISAMGTVIGIVALDSGGILFATVQDVPYYNGMEFLRVYPYDEMMGYLEVFEKKTEGCLSNPYLP